MISTTGIKTPAFGCLSLFGSCILPSIICTDLIFVTDITDYIRGEKSVMSVKSLNNLWSFIEIYAVFILDLCGYI